MHRSVNKVHKLKQVKSVLPKNSLPMLMIKADDSLDLVEGKVQFLPQRGHYSWYLILLTCFCKIKRKKKGRSA